MDKLNDRSKCLINNILIKLVNEADFPLEDLEPWLRTEVGFTEEEISELKAEGRFPALDPEAER